MGVSGIKDHIKKIIGCESFSQLSIMKKSSHIIISKLLLVLRKVKIHLPFTKILSSTPLSPFSNTISTKINFRRECVRTLMVVE